MFASWMNSTRGNRAALAFAAALALVSLPAMSFADDSAVSGTFSRDNIVQFIAALEGGGNSDAAQFRRSFSKRSDRRILPVKVLSEQDGVRLITVADADPNFARWQRDADERLKQENSTSTPKQHPFALAHPDKSIVVCEAGCGPTTKDEIVYMEAVVPAVLPQLSGRLEPDSSLRTDPAAVGLQDGELPCLAGCYRNIHHEASAHIDSDKAGGNDAHGVSGERSLMLERVVPAPQSAPVRKGASADKRASDGTAFTLTAPDFYDGWRTKIEFVNKPRASLAPRAWGRTSIVVSEKAEDAQR